MSIYSNLLFTVGYDLTMATPQLIGLLDSRFNNPGISSTSICSGLLHNSSYLKTIMDSFLFTTAEWHPALSDASHRAMASSIFTQVDMLKMLEANYANLYGAIIAIVFVFLLENVGF
jgi:hypothetical protein